MNTLAKTRLVFRIAALYELVLGIAFLFAAKQVFSWAEIEPPNHPGYVQFPAALLIVFGIMFAAIARQPDRNRNLILYGILLKVSYCSVVLFHWIATDLPFIWKPFFVADILFLFAFVWAQRALSAKVPQEEAT